MERRCDTQWSGRRGGGFAGRGALVRTGGTPMLPVRVDRTAGAAKDRYDTHMAGRRAGRPAWRQLSAFCISAFRLLCLQAGGHRAGETPALPGVGCAVGFVRHTQTHGATRVRAGGAAADRLSPLTQHAPSPRAQRLSNFISRNRQGRAKLTGLRHKAIIA